MVCKGIEEHSAFSDSPFSLQVAQQLRVPLKLLKGFGGATMVVEGGEKLKGDYLWARWRKGRKDLGVMADYVDLPASEEKNIWTMTIEARKELRDLMEGRYKEDTYRELAEAMTVYQSSKDELRSIYDNDKRMVLQKARVIGCTTTGAAIHKELLDDVAPGVVLIEEAGEILEAHCITSVATRTKHMILIGDHKQLRPKLESYELSVESGKGHDFNRSLFERLATSDFPYVTLGVQHRMRPEISLLIKPTYPALQDHPSVLDKDKVRGLKDNVVFITHKVCRLLPLAVVSPLLRLFPLFPWRKQ